MTLCSFASDRDGKDFTISLLRPKPFLVAGVKQPVLSLNGDWSFTNNESTKSIKVPGEWEMQGFTVNEGETAVYSRPLSIPADWKGYRVIIRFDGVSSHAVVKLNGKKVMEHEGSFVPFEADITNELKQNGNVLKVEVQALTISDKLACTSQYAVHTVGGLLRNVQLMALPETHISDISIVTNFDKQYKNASLNIRANMLAGKSTMLVYTLRDANGKIITTKKGFYSALQNAAIPVANAHSWNPEDPYLYELTTELQQNGKILETLKQKVGFRQVEVKNSRVYVNGHPIKLHGVNRHSIHPLTGRSISSALDIQDAVLFREANCNYIRTSHYPPTEEFLNACDSLGLFVEDESSLCWIQHHASPIWKKWNYKDEKFLPYMVQANTEKIMAARNHPSIIMWSLGNESRWSPLWAKVNELVKKLDPTRPTVFHDQCWGGFNNDHSTADIANYHYPGINGAGAMDTMSRPVLFGEYAHITTYSRRELLTDPGVRSSYGAPLAMMYDSIYHHDKCLGGAIWSGIDDVFHLSDGRIVGYGPWGIIDAWRRKKPEFFGVKKAYSPVRVTHVDQTGKAKGYLVITVENRYDFTSLKNIKIKTFFDDNAGQTLHSSIPPHGKDTIKIALKNGARRLHIQFIDPRGFIANEEAYTLTGNEQRPIAKNHENNFTENASSITVTQGPVHYLISKNTGIITSVKKGNNILLKQGPVFSIVPMNSEDGGKPNVAGETYQNNIYPLKSYPLYTIFASDISATKSGDSVLVKMLTTFSDNSTAHITYVFKENRLSVAYAVTYKGKDERPYQYGMLMQLSKGMDRLSWKRKGEFSAYPATDIAREKGSAMLNARPTSGVEAWRVEPKTDWKDDATELGSNDFRATRKNIMEVVLNDKNGNTVTAYGFGKQASRSWLQDERIQWLVADYTNNGSEPFYGTPFTNGQENIKGKTLYGRLLLEF